MTHKTYKKVFVLLAVGAVLAVGGYVAALNGFFGGGAAIPEDTMTRGLVGYWSMDESAGQTAFDASGNSNNGTLGSSSSADTADPKWTKGKQGGGMKFDGVDDYVNCGAGASLKPTQYVTMEFWANPFSHSATSATQLFGFLQQKGYTFWQYTSGAGSVLWVMELNLDGITRRYLDIPVSFIPINTWTHVVLVFDTVNGKFYAYQNGVLVYSKVGVPTGDIIYSGNFYIGKKLNGSIDDVRIYNRALSAEEVRYHYNRGGPVAEWKFDEGSGTKAFDSTENNNNGTLTNFSSTDTGTATSATANTLTQTGKTWTVNQWTNGAINITAGTGIGQTRTISSNTADTITISSNWTTNPDATSTYSLAQAPAFTTGKYGSAISFDGVDDYVNAGNAASLNITGAITIEAWVKRSSVPTTYEGIVSKRSADASIGYALSMDNTITKGLWLIKIDGVSKSVNSPTFSLNTWTHIVGVYNGTTLIAYANGIGGTPLSVSGNISITSESLYIGKGVAAYSNGSIDEVRIYNYARTVDEIRLDYQSGYATYLGPSGKTCSEDPASCMDQGLVGNWGMEEGAGQKAYDASGNNNNGTLGASASSASDDPRWTKGKNGGGLKFDGVDDRVTIPDNDSLDFGFGDFSVEFWMNSYCANSIGCEPVSKWNWISSNEEGFMIRHHPGQNFVFIIGNGAGGNDNSVSTAVTLNEMHHITALRKDATLYLYVDSKLKNTGTAGGANLNIDTSANILIGGVSNRPFQGIVDEVRIYNRALSAEEVRYHYNRGGPVAEWKFDEGSGQKVYDSAGNADGQLGSDSLPAGDVNDPGWGTP